MFVAPERQLAADLVQGIGDLFVQKLVHCPLIFACKEIASVLIEPSFVSNFVDPAEVHLR